MYAWRLAGATWYSTDFHTPYYGYITIENRNSSWTKKTAPQGPVSHWLPTPFPLRLLISPLFLLFFTECYCNYEVPGARLYWAVSRGPLQPAHSCFRENSLEHTKHKETYYLFSPNVPGLAGPSNPVQVQVQAAQA